MVKVKAEILSALCVSLFVSVQLPLPTPTPANSIMIKIPNHPFRVITVSEIGDIV